MDENLPAYTVIGVANGRFNVRVHHTCRARDAPAALRLVQARVASSYQEASPGVTGFIAAAVFSGRLRCAHLGSVNGPWGEDRSGLLRPNSRDTSPFTVVAVDPATSALKVLQGNWPAAGNAERDPALDFYLLASVLEGSHEPVVIQQNPLEPASSSRNERIVAMLRYSANFAQFLGTRAPIHMPR